MTGNKCLQYIHNVLNEWNIYNSTDLKYARILIFSLLTILFLKDYSSILNDQPGAFLPPFLSPAWVLGGVPPKWVLLFFSIILGLSGLALCFEYKKTLWAIIFVISYWICKSYYYSFGKVEHAYSLLLLFPAFGIITNWGQKKKAWIPLPSLYFLFALSIGLAFLSAGIPKLYTGWLAFDTQEVRQHLIEHTFGLELGIIGSLPLHLITSSLGWELFDWMAVIFEMGLIITILKPRWFLRGLLICWVFHVLNCWMFGIYFSGMLLCYLVFIPYSRLKIQQIWTLIIILILSVITAQLLEFWRVFTVTDWPFFIMSIITGGVIIVSNMINLKRNVYGQNRKGSE